MILAKYSLQGFHLLIFQSASAETFVLCSSLSPINFVAQCLVLGHGQPSKVKISTIFHVLRKSSGNSMSVIFKV